MHKYITKNEYKKPRNISKLIINEVRRELKDTFKFYELLIGSAKYRLVTRNGNEPFDFDFSLCLTKIDDNLIDEPRKIRELFLEAFKKVSSKYGFEVTGNGSRAIKLKRKDKNGFTIDFIIEVAIITKINGKMNILKQDKKKDEYIWNIEEDHQDLNNKFFNIRRTDWKLFKEKYLNKKNEYLRESKKIPSISIFKEVINEFEQQKY